MTYLYDYHREIEGILAKQALAESEFRKAAAVEASVADAVLGVLTTAVIGAQRCGEASLNWLVDPLTAISGMNCAVNRVITAAELYTDSQPTFPESQAIRMRDARIINRRARQHAVRLFPSEEPFLPEEPSVRPPSRDVSRVVRLKPRR